MTQTTATAAERHILVEFLTILDKAKGDSDALAEVRRLTSIEIDKFLTGLRGHGIDTDNLYDEVEAELFGEL